jgi:UDP-glucose 4-epimerase
MEDRKWDLPDWYANINNAVKDFNWKPSVKLEQGLLKTSDWQNSVDFDNALWNFIPRIK